MILLLGYVDDILITGESQDDIQQVIKDLHNQFALKNLGLLGFEITHSSTGLHLNQSKYARDLLHKKNMIAAKPSLTPMCLGNRLSLNDSELFAYPSMYRSTIGTLQYLTLTGPDLSFSVNKLSQFLKAPAVAHWTACKRILPYIKGTLNYGLLFKPAQLLTLEGFYDADWVSNIDDRKSVSGIFIFLGGNLITWSSQKQKVVAASSTEAEYRALASAAADLIWIQILLAELDILLPSQPPILWSDNLEAIRFFMLEPNTLSWMFTLFEI